MIPRALKLFGLSLLFALGFGIDAEAGHLSVTVRNVGATQPPRPTRTATPRVSPTAAPSRAYIPGVIQCENFEAGGEGIGYHDADAANNGGALRPSEGVDIEATTGGGYHVTSTSAGEWLSYSTYANTGDHVLQVRVASTGAGGTFHLEVGGSNITGSLTIPDTGGAQSWYTLIRTVNVPVSGLVPVRLVIDTNGANGAAGNFNYFSLAPVRPPATPSPAATPTLPANQVYTFVPSSTYFWLPGTLEVENFEVLHQDTGYSDTDTLNTGGAYRPSEAVDIESTSDVGGGYDVMDAKATEWLEYCWATPRDGTGPYTLRVRVASAGPGGRFHVEVGGVDVSGALTVPDTGGAQNWQTISKTVTLPVIDRAKVRLVMDANGPSGTVGRFNHLTFDPGATPTPRATSPTPTYTRTFTPTHTPTFTPTRTPTARAIPEWKVWTWYPVGAVVSYQGATYKCIQAHTTQPDWPPSLVPALWQRL